MGFLEANQVLFYYPFSGGSYREWVRGEFESAKTYSEITTDGIVGSGTIGTAGGSNIPSIYTSASPYNDDDNFTSFVCAFWTKGFSQYDSTKYFGFTNASHLLQSYIGFVKDSNSKSRLQYKAYSSSHTFAYEGPTLTDEETWIFIIIRVEFNGSNAHGYMSINGSDWLDCGTNSDSTYFRTLGNYIEHKISRQSYDSDNRSLDEIITWANAKRFSSSELINLYDLAGLGLAMNQYTPYFPLQSSDDITLFIQGPLPIYDNITLYTYSFDLESKYCTLYEVGHEVLSSGISLSLKTPCGAGIDLVCMSPLIIGDDITLYERGITQESGSCTLFTINFEQIASGIPLVVHSAHEVCESGITLYTSAFDILGGGISGVITGGLYNYDNVFVRVNQQHSYNNAPLVIYGSNVEGTKYKDGNISLFLYEYDSVDTRTVTRIGKFFTKVLEGSGLIPSTGSGLIFVRTFNQCVHDDVTLFMHGATTPTPIWHSNSSYFNCVITGSGLITSEGYIPYRSKNNKLFARVSHGAIDDITLVINGVIWPFREATLYICGYKDTIASGITLFIGKDLMSAHSGINLYLNTGQNGYTGNATLYTHGYF